MMRSVHVWFIVVVATVAALLAVPATAGRVELKNEISGLQLRKSKLAVRCWSNEDDLGWTVLKPGEVRSWTFTTMNMWPFKKTEFKCQFRSGLGTTKDDMVTVFSVRDGFRNECKVTGPGGDECIWVAKRDGFYQRRIIKDGIGFRYVVDVLRSKWVWKW